MLLHAVNKAILNNHLSKNKNSGVGSAAHLNRKIDYDAKLKINRLLAEDAERGKTSSPFPFPIYSFAQFSRLSS